MINIKIKFRNYKGFVGEGTIITEEYSFKIKDNVCTSESQKEFCSNEKYGLNNLSSVTISLPFLIDDKNIDKIVAIIEKIKNNKNYIYNEKRFDVDKFDFNRYSYTDIFIDDNHYELSNRTDINMLDDLKNLLNIPQIDKVLKSDIKELIEIENK